MTERVIRFVTNWRAISWGIVALVVLAAYTWGVDWAVSNWPPYRTLSLSVVTQDGVPVKVVESRKIVTKFNGSWRVRVVDLDRGEVRCYLPEMGPRAQTYRVGGSPAFAPSWHGYTGDNGDCLRAMLAHPGIYQIETHRTMSVLWRDVDLPLVVSGAFEVGEVR